MQISLVDGRYEVLRLLGRGGMGEVYLARDELLGREVALKVVKGHHAASEEFRERFRREARHAASLSHPNVVEVFDAGEDEDGAPYIAMEYLSGGTLSDRLVQEGTLEPEEAVSIALRTAAALGEIHRRGVIHRDIKPQNVFLAPKGEVKVGDFGIARAAEATAMTRASLILGTVAYLSPEQAKGESVGPASDLYSLGIVLYEMLTGSVPFSADGPLATAIKHLTEVPPSVGEANPCVPPALEAVTMRLLAKDPAERYEDALELARELERSRVGGEADFAYRGLPTKPASRPEKYGGRRLVPRRIPWVPLYLACAGLLSVAALLAFVNPAGLYEDFVHALKPGPTPAISEASNPAPEGLEAGEALVPKIARPLSHDRSERDVQESNADPAAKAATPLLQGLLVPKGTGDPPPEEASAPPSTREQSKQPEQSQGTARIGAASTAPLPSRASPARAEGAPESWVALRASPPPVQPVAEEPQIASAATAAPASPTPPARPTPAQMKPVQHQSWRHAAPQSATPRAPKSAADPMAGERAVDVGSAPVTRTENVSVASSGWRGIPEGSIGPGAASPIANVQGTGREESALRMHERRSKDRPARKQRIDPGRGSE